MYVFVFIYIYINSNEYMIIYLDAIRIPWITQQLSDIWSALGSEEEGVRYQHCAFTVTIAVHR